MGEVSTLVATRVQRLTDAQEQDVTALRGNQGSPRSDW